MPRKQTKQKKSQKLSNGIKLFLTVIIVALLTFGVLSLMRYLSDEKREIDDQKDKNTAAIYDNKKDNSKTESTSEGYDQKDQAEKDADAKSDNQTGDNGKTIGNVVISSAGVLNDKVIASGMVSNVIEEGGTCMYAFTNGEETITETTTSISNADNTVCQSALLDKNRFNVGVWEVSLQYQSNKTEGQSETQTFEVK